MVMRDGNVISVGDSPISQEQLFGAFDHIASQVGRLDGEALCEYHRRCDGEALDAHRQRGGRLAPALAEMWRADAEQRGDALPAGVTAFPRDLEFIRARELEQIRKPLNSMRLFPVDRSVPVGYREHTWRRRVGRGRAVLTRGDTQDYGSARTGRVEEKFPVCYIVCSVRQTYFEMLATDVAGVQQYASDIRQAYQTVDELNNQINWSGNAETGLHGALSHPHLLVSELGVVFGGAATSTPEVILAALHRFSDTPARLSGEAASPTILATSPNIYRHISQTRLAAGTDTTILQFFLANQDPQNGIRQVTKCQELTAIGPSGQDGMIAFRDDVDSLAIVEVLPTMTMPIYQASAMSWLTVIVAATGGVVQPNVCHNVVGYASAP